MRITKIAHKDGRTSIDREDENLGSPEFTSLPKCRDKPEPSFFKALSALAGDVLFVLELPVEYGEEEFEVISTSVDYDKHGNRGFVFSARKKVGAGVFSVSTPRLRERANEDGEGGEEASDVFLTHDQLKRVDALLMEAARYLSGKREQLSLDIGEGGGDPVGAEEESEVEA